MRRSKITPLLVDLIIEARRGGLSFAKTASFCQVGVRTIYDWLAEGRRAWVARFCGNLHLDNLPYSAAEPIRLKIRLAEEVYQLSGDSEKHYLERYEKFCELDDFMANEEIKRENALIRKRNPALRAGKRGLRVRPAARFT